MNEWSFARLTLLGGHQLLVNRPDIMADVMKEHPDSYTVGNIMDAMFRRYLKQYPNGPQETFILELF